MPTQTNTPPSVHAYTREQTVAAFGDRVFGSAEALVLVLADAHCGQAEQTAINKSAAALGYNDPPTYCLVDLPSPLNEDQLFSLVEGLDPACVVLVGATACTLAAQTYRCNVPTFGKLRLFGRNACAFADLSHLLETEDGRQRVWAALKSLQA